MGNLWKSLLMVSLLMVSCVSINERYEEASECQLVAGADCQKLWDRWNHAIEAKERRDAERANHCPPGYIEFCNATCSATKGTGECVKSSSVKWY